MSRGTRQLSTCGELVLYAEAKPMRYARYASVADGNGDTDIDSHTDSISSEVVTFRTDSAASVQCKLGQ